MKKDFYSTNEVAQITGLTNTTIRSYIYRGQIEATKFDRSYMITQEALDKWLNERKEKPGNRRKAGGSSND